MSLPYLQTSKDSTGVSGRQNLNASLLSQYFFGPATRHTMSRKHGSEGRLRIELSIHAAGWGRTTLFEIGSSGDLPLARTSLNCLTPMYMKP
jgi:hypothetical protein